MVGSMENEMRAEAGSGYVMMQPMDCGTGAGIPGYVAHKIGFCWDKNGVVHVKI